jgi:endonuclease/exonuclease/phosphatase family metal-dependent hydrolase/endonuclease YncB( thermonuclease family)
VLRKTGIGIALAIGLALTTTAAPATAGSSPKSGTAINGYTIQLGNGNKIRLPGVIAPSQGECGYAEAKRVTDRFIANGFTTEKPPKGQRNRNGTKLRFVANPAGKDLGKRLLKKGMARAAYDANDDYKKHGKDKQYRKLDKKTVGICDRAPKPTSGQRLKVATYNICKYTCPNSPLAWYERRDAVFLTMKSAKADVLAVQEATDYGSQRVDVANAMNSSGYTLLPEVGDCGENCLTSTGILFRRSRVKPLDLPNGQPGYGMISPMSLTGPVDWEDIGNRGFSWALLKHLPTQKPFLAVSVHLTSEASARAEEARQISTRVIANWMQESAKKWGYDDLPLIFAGDLNSYQERNPTGPQRILANDGFTDGFTAADKKNPQYSTGNFFSNGSWPKKPTTYKDPPRIDYIFAAERKQPIKYGVSIRLLANGDFDPEYYGSDHNLVWSDWNLLR